MSNFIEVSPAPKMAESLRHLGYSVQAAIADIIDNSIDAAATDIKVDIKGEGTSLSPVSEINIFDNGCGMYPDEIIVALTMGSETQKSTTALGCFGMGLKTGATSIGRRLLVYSRKDGKLVCYAYDLDVNGERNEWVIQELYPTEEETKTFNEAVGPENSGTWIKIAKIDCNEYKHVKSMVKSLCGQKSLRMTFRKILNGGCNITINTKKLEPWGYDFVKGHKVLDEFIFKPDGSELGTIKIITTGGTEHKGGSGRKQGIVVVRNNRDITAKTPEWHGVWSFDWELTGVYVIWEVNSSEFDQIMSTTLMKDGWSIPQDIKDKMKQEISTSLQAYIRTRTDTRAKIKQNSSVNKVLESYGNNLNNNMNMIRKPEVDNKEMNPLVEKKNHTETKKEKSQSEKTKRQSTKGIRYAGESNDVWKFVEDYGCGDGRHFQVDLRRTKSRRVFTMSLDTKHPWIKKHFVDSELANAALYALLDDLVGDAYMEMKIGSEADVIIRQKADFLRSKSHVTAVHDKPHVLAAAAA